MGPRVKRMTCREHKTFSNRFLKRIHDSTALLDMLFLCWKPLLHIGLPKVLVAPSPIALELFRIETYYRPRQQSYVKDAVILGFEECKMLFRTTLSYTELYIFLREVFILALIRANLSIVDNIV